MEEQSQLTILNWLPNCGVLKEHGQKNRYYYEEIGVNSRLDALQAAILQIKLPYLDTWNSQRKQSLLIISGSSIKFLGSLHPKN